jgi:PhnB protein
MQVQPYIFFDGRCDEALDFYKKAVGAKVDMLMRFKDAPDQSMISPGSQDKVMHAAVHLGDTQVLMSDGRCQGKTNFQGFSLAVSVKDEAEADKTFTALAERRPGDHAAGQDFLLAALRHADGQVRRRLDGPGRPAVKPTP